MPQDSPWVGVLELAGDLVQCLVAGQAALVQECNQACSHRVQHDEANLVLQIEEHQNVG